MTTTPLTVLYDADCGFCNRTALVLRRLDRRRRLRLVPLQAPASRLPAAPSQEQMLASMHVVDAEGRWAAGGEAFLRIAGLVPVLLPLALVGRLPLLRSLVQPLYELVAANRHRLSRLLGDVACRFPGDPP